MDIAEPARKKALKRSQPMTEAEMDPMGFTATPRAPIASGPDIPTTQTLPLAPGVDRPMSQAELIEASRTYQQPAPGSVAERYGMEQRTSLMPAEEVQDIRRRGAETEARFDLEAERAAFMEQQAQYQTQYPDEFLPWGAQPGAGIPPKWSEEATAAELDPREFQQSLLTDEQRAEAVLARQGQAPEGLGIPEFMPGVEPRPAFATEDMPIDPARAGGAALRGGEKLIEPFEVLAETGAELVSGKMPTLFKDGWTATVEDHRKRSIKQQIGLGLIFDPFVVAKAFTIPIKATKSVVRSSIKSQLKQAIPDIAERELDDAVEEIAIQYERKDLAPSEYRAATRNQNVLGNFDDPDLAFGADELAMANRDPNMVYRYDPDLPPEEARAAAPSPAAALDELPGFTQDNPLVNAQQVGNPSLIKGAEDWIAKNQQTRTGGFRNIELPTDDVARLPGLMGEETWIDDPRHSQRIKELADDMRERGWIGDSVDVDVDVDSVVRIFEGNHRVRAAQLAGLDQIPVNVRYLGGSEMSTGPWSPNDLVQKSAPSPVAAAPSPAAVPEEVVGPRWVGEGDRLKLENAPPGTVLTADDLFDIRNVAKPGRKDNWKAFYKGTDEEVALSTLGRARYIRNRASLDNAAEVWAARMTESLAQQATPSPAAVPTPVAAAREVVEQAPVPAPTVRPSTKSLRTPGDPPTPMARIANFVDEPDYQFTSDNVIQDMSSQGGRDMVVVDVPNHGPQAFYRSTGKNSGKPGEWLPFDGMSQMPAFPGWFDKARFTGSELSDDMMRYGTPELKEMSERLTSMNIPEGQVIRNQRDINTWLNTPESLRQNSLADEIAARGDPQDTPPPPRGSSPEDIIPTPAEDPAVPVAADVPPTGPPTPPPGRMTGDEPPMRFNDDGSTDLMPPVENNIINLQPIRIGLTFGEKVRDLAARTIGRPFGAVPLDPYATPAMRERFRVRQVIENISGNLGAWTKAQFARRRDGSLIFEFDNQGRIPSLDGVDPTLPGAPTIQDLAARLPRYIDSLTPEQVRALRELEIKLRPFRVMLDELDFDISTRMDVMDDLVWDEPGFYIPRGRTALEGADTPIRVGGGRPRGRAGFERSATFESMSEGINKGHQYGLLDEVVQVYAQEAGVRALNKHIANFFISIKEESVQGITPKMRLFKQNPDLVLAKQDLDRNLNRLKSLLGRMTERQQQVIDDFIFNDEYDNIDALFDALTSIQAAGGPNAGASIREVRPILSFEHIVKVDINKIRPKWKAALKKAQTAGRGERVIDLAELNNRTFPVALADAANAVLKAEKREPLPIFREMAALNNLYRGFNATGDNSALGIQGLLGLASDPQAYVEALGTNFRAWGRGGDQVLGQFLMAFDDKAIKSGRMNSIAWGQETLHLGGQNTEFLIGPGNGSFLNRVPGIRQANRAFGYFGDALRLQWADDELERLIRTTGRSIEELRSSGEVRKIAEAVNGATGYSPGKTFGDIGDLIFFAPRFLQARMETVSRGLMSLRPGATVEQRFARRSLIKLIGYGTLVTYLANWMLGNKTEFKPMKDGRYNSNFMRIRFGDRDISVFGSWELFPRAILATASGNPQQIIRGLGSGVVSSTWDLLWNKDFMGKAVYDNPQDFAEWILGHVTPFAADELLPTTKNLAKGVTGDTQSLVAGITSAITETLGIKSSPLSGREATMMAREAQAQEMGHTKPYEELPPWVRKEIDETPAVAQAKAEWEKQQRERQSKYRLYKDEDDEMVADVYNLIDQLAKDVGPGRQARDAITLHQRDLATNRQSLRERSSEALQWFDEKEPAKGFENKVMEEYADLIFNDDLVNPVTFVYDFDKRDERIAGLRQKHGDEVIDKIEAFIHDGEHPLVKELRDDRELLREYWELEDDYLANMPLGVKDRIEFYRESSKTGRSSLPGQWADITPHMTAIENIRRGYRTQNRQVDEALAKWGYRAVPGNMDIRIKYADTRFLPAEPGGSLQPQAQPVTQPAAQPSGAGSFTQRLLGGATLQPTPSPQPTPGASGGGSFTQRLLAGAR